jgi:hypothetical protein
MLANQLTPEGTAENWDLSLAAIAPDEERQRLALRGVPVESPAAR